MNQDSLEIMKVLPDDAVIRANQESLEQMVNKIDAYIEGSTGFVVNQIFIERDYHAEGKPLKVKIITALKDDE